MNLQSYRVRRRRNKKAKEEKGKDLERSEKGIRKRAIYEERRIQAV